MKKRAIYTDTSVFGGVFNWEFERASRLFFEQVRAGQFSIVTSGLVVGEIDKAPFEVTEWFKSLKPFMEIAPLTEEVYRLANAYVKAGIVGKGSLTDATHVAAATVSGSGIIVSWNFRHIVHFEKTPLYNALNRICGYNEIAICSPQEVIRYE